MSENKKILNTENVIDVIYYKYPCVEKYMSDKGLIMAPFKQACSYILKSKFWFDYLKQKRYNEGISPSNRNLYIDEDLYLKYKKYIDNNNYLLNAEYNIFGIKDIDDDDLVVLTRLYNKYVKNVQPKISLLDKKDLQEIATLLNIRRKAKSSRKVKAKTSTKSKRVRRSTINSSIDPSNIISSLNRRTTRSSNFAFTKTTRTVEPSIKTFPTSVKVNDDRYDIITIRNDTHEDYANSFYKSVIIVMKPNINYETVIQEAFKVKKGVIEYLKLNKNDRNNKIIQNLKKYLLLEDGKIEPERAYDDILPHSIFTIDDYINFQEKELSIPDIAMINLVSEFLNITINIIEYNALKTTYKPDYTSPFDEVNLLQDESGFYHPLRKISYISSYKPSTATSVAYNPPKRKIQEEDENIMTDEEFLDILNNLQYHEKPLPTDIFKDNRNIQNAFINFMDESFSNCCYVDYETQEKEQKRDFLTNYIIKPIANIFNDELNFYGNITGSYVRDIILDNLAMCFPDSFYDSNGEDYKEDPDFEKGNLSLGIVDWERKPEFPTYACIVVFNKADLAITSFISAKKGWNTQHGIKDYDVYGQLICTDKSHRNASGAGKALLIATILMCYQYKVNYVFIQAFRGILNVQAPLYYRFGFEFFRQPIPEIINRITGFQQFINYHPSKNISSKSEYDNELTKEFQKVKALSEKQKQEYYYTGWQQRTSTLLPMFLNIRSYDTSLACNILEVKGYDYHEKGQTKLTGGIGTTARIYLQSLDTSYTPDTTIRKEITRPSTGYPDGHECKESNECISKLCVDNICKPRYNRYGSRRLITGTKEMKLSDSEIDNDIPITLEDQMLRNSRLEQTRVSNLTEREKMRSTRIKQLELTKKTLITKKDMPRVKERDDETEKFIQRRIKNLQTKKKDMSNLESISYNLTGKYEKEVRSMCIDIIDSYITTVNSLDIRNGIIEDILKKKGWDTQIGFAKCHIALPNEKATELITFYKGQIYGKPEDKIVVDLTNELKKLKQPIILFTVGAVIGTDNISDHVGFLYFREINTIRKYDPGMQSWETGFTRIIDNIIKRVLPDTTIITTYSGKNMLGKLLNPQDYTRGNTLYEGYVKLTGYVGLDWWAHHRESFCQTWSMLLPLNDLSIYFKAPDRFKIDYPVLQDFSTMSAREMGIAVRIFILYLVSTFTEFQKDYNDNFKPKLKKEGYIVSDRDSGDYPYKDLLLVCMKNFDNSIEIPVITRSNRTGQIYDKMSIELLDVIHDEYTVD